MSNQPPDGLGAADPADEDTSDELHLLDAEMLRRLHGEACIRCGAAEDLHPAGYRYTTTGNGTRYGWPVYTCPGHTPR